MSEIINWITSAPGNFKDFVIANQANPVMWICFFFGGLLIFYLTYSALNKNK